MVEFLACPEVTSLALCNIFLFSLPQRYSSLGPLNSLDGWLREVCLSASGTVIQLLFGKRSLQVCFAQHTHTKN